MQPVRNYPSLQTFLLMIVNNFATKIYDDMTLEKALEISDMGSELCIPSAAIGYVQLLLIDEDVIPKLGIFRKINANGRWLFQCAVMNISYVENLLKMAFDDQNMVNTLVSNYLYEYDVFQMTFYDPFSLNNGEIRGEFHHLLLSKNVTETDIKNYLEKFNRRTTNLRQYEMLVDIFPRSMYAEPIYNRFGKVSYYRFLEGDIIDILSRIMNFKIVYSIMNTAKMPGITLPNGTAIHGLGLIEYEKVNYSATTRILKEQGLNNTAYLYPVELFDVYYVVPKLYPIKIISLSGWGLFDLTTIVMIWVTVFCCIVVRYIINQIESEQSNCHDVGRLAQQVIGFQNGISQSIAAITSNSDRLIIISCLLLYLVVGTSYQGLILAQLQEKDASQLNTLKQVLESGLDLSTVIEASDIFKPVDGRTELSVRNKMYYKQMADFEKNDRRMVMFPCKEWQAGHQVAILMREKTAQFVIGTCYDDTPEKDFLHMVPEKGATFQSSQAVPKSSPFIQEFNMNILYIFQAGLNSLSEIESDQTNYIEMIRRYRNVTKNRIEERQKLVGLENLKEAFGTLIVAWVISFVVLLLEIGWHRLKQDWLGWDYAFHQLRQILYGN